MGDKKNKERVLLICIVDGREFLDKLLESFLEIGLAGATVLQSQGMGRVLARDFPLFAGFKELLEKGGPFNYTVMSVIEDLRLVDEVKLLLPKLEENELKEGILFTIPISQFVKFSDLPSGPSRDS